MREGIQRTEKVRRANGRFAIPKSPRRQRVTAAESIYQKMRDDIVTMRLLPRTPLQESQLTKQFDVSRTPLREALIRLAKEGLVDVFAQSGTFVAPIPLGELPEAVAIRKALEQVTVERAARTIDAAGRDKLDDILRQQKSYAEDEDYEAFHQADEAFHEAIAMIAGYPGIWRLLKQTKAHIDRYRRLTLPVPGRMQRVIHEHRKVVAALRKGQVRDARVAMRAHLDAILPGPEPLLARHPDYFK
jgi:DNA-binding GntR family transcriptional regulator